MKLRDFLFLKPNESLIKYSKGIYVVVKASIHGIGVKNILRTEKKEMKCAI